MFTVALCLIANKYMLHFNPNEVYAITWMNLENTTLSERSQLQRTTYYMTI